MVRLPSGAEAVKLGAVKLGAVKFNLLLAAAVWAGVGCRPERAHAAELPEATMADVPYGPHRLQKIDVWLAEGDGPRPLVAYFHGGGWAAEDKSNIHEHLDVRAFLRAGISVAAVNYRLLSDANAAKISPPVKWPLGDGARAVQFLRSKAMGWRFDKTRFAATGVSAGGGTSLWLAMHDDMADRQSDDPVARESTRFDWVAVTAPVVSLDPQQLREWIPNSVFSAHAFGFADLSRADSFAPFLAARERYLAGIHEYSPIAHASPDDPPVFVEYPLLDKPPVPGETQADPSHSPVLGLMLQKKLESLGVPAELRYFGDGKRAPANVQQYLTQKLTGFSTDTGAMPTLRGHARRGATPAIVGLWLMGQSLCDGSESLPLVTTTDPGWGNLMFRQGVRTWLQANHGSAPDLRAASQFAWVPLVATANGALGETIANGLADHLKASLVDGDRVRAQSELPHFLVAYAGQGGRTIEELSIADESTDPRTPAFKQAGGGYYKTSLDDARRAAAHAKARGQQFQIAALVWMQGEANSGPTGGIVPSRWMKEYTRPLGQMWYRDRLIAYRKQWSDDLRAITGQSGEIPMFTYQTQAAAGEAQLLASDVDPYLFMVGPHYMMPSALNSVYSGTRRGGSLHLSADAQRWFGEQAAKVVRRVVFEGEVWRPLVPRRAWIEPSRASILIDFKVPRPPLVLDDHFLPRQQRELGDRKAKEFSCLYGFQIRDAARKIIPLAAVEVASPTRVRIRLATALPADTLFTLSYGFPHAGQLGVVKAIRKSPDVGSRATTELVLDRAFPPALEPMLAEGAFMVSASMGKTYAQATIRAVGKGGGQSSDACVLRFDDQELRNHVPFEVGQVLTALRPHAYGNLRDSDPEQAIYSFGDSSYGRRAGQRYPLWNWCVALERFPIADAESPSQQPHP